MVETPLPIATGFYRSRSLPIAAQECVNWVPSKVEGPGLAEKVLFGSPGLHQVATTGPIEEINRGSWEKDGIPYFVNGETLYRMLSDFSFETLGTIPGADRVSMSSNNTQVFVLIPGGAGFIYDDDTSTFSEITDPDFTANGNPQYVAYVDGYFALTTDDKKWIISALNDGLSYDPLDRAAAEVDPDGIVSLVIQNNQVFIAGKHTIEVFQNSPTGSGFPFQRVQGFVLQTGVSAPFSLINASDTFFFIGAGEREEPVIRRFTGNGAEIVSTDGIDAILEDFTEDEISAAFAMSYAQNGSRFVIFTIADFTLVYDSITGDWHTRSSRVELAGIGERDVRWRVNSIVQAYGRLLVGDSQDGRIGDMQLDFYDEYGNEIIRQFVTITFSNLGAPISVPSLELTVESGVGDNATPDPKIWLEMSKDAKRWSNPITRSLGRIGEYNHRVIWRRLGRFPRMMLCRISMSDIVKPVIIKLEGDLV